MSEVYIVSYLDLTCQEFLTKAFADFEAAKQCAVNLATKLSLNRKVFVDKNPPQEDIEDGYQWFFVDEDTIFIAVTFQKLNSSVNDPSDFIKYGDEDVKPFIPSPYNYFSLSDGYQFAAPPIVPLPAPIPIVNPDPIHTVIPVPSRADKIINADGLDVPAGFSISNKPLTNEHLLNYPYQFKSATSDLTEAQKWALVSARIKKLPNYYIIIENICFDQQFSLVELSKKSEIGLEIRDYECQKLDDLRDRRGQELNGDENEF